MSPPTAPPAEDEAKTPLNPPPYTESCAPPPPPPNNATVAAAAPPPSVAMQPAVAASQTYYAQPVMMQPPGVAMQPVAPPPVAMAPVVQQPMAAQQQQSVTSTNVTVNATMKGDGDKQRLVLVELQDLEAHGRQWSTGLCECLKDVTGCLCTALFLPCAMMRLANRLGECACLPVCCPGGMSVMRTQLRIMGGIRGSLLGDLCLPTLCPCCVACQMSREIDRMKL